MIDDLKDFSEEIYKTILKNQATLDINFFHILN